MKILITHKDVLGQMARWSVEQHPFGWPEGLKDVLAKVAEAAKQWGESLGGLQMWWVESPFDIDHWLREVLADDPVIKAWNTPRSGHSDEMVFVSRHDGPSPENDFVDIDALFRNVATSVWRDQLREQGR